MFTELPSPPHVNYLGGEYDTELSFDKQPGLGPRLGPLQHRLDNAHVLVAGSNHPIAPQRDRETENAVSAIAIADGVVERPSKVRLVGVETFEPAALLLPGEVRCGGLGERQIVPTVRITDGESFALVELEEPFGAELSDRLEKVVTGFPTGRLHDDQVLVDKRSQQVGDLEHLDVAETADRFSSLEFETLREHG